MVYSKFSLACILINIVFSATDLQEPSPTITSLTSTTEYDINNSSDSDEYCICNPDGSRRRRRLGHPRINRRTMDVNVSLNSNKSSAVIYFTTEYDNDNDTDTDSYDTDDIYDHNNTDSDSYDNDNNSTNINDDDSSDENCPCKYTTTSAPIAPCQDGYEAGIKCTAHIDCSELKFCDSNIGGYCCLEYNPQSVDRNLQDKTFTEKIAYYYDNNTVVFIVIILGLSMVIFSLLCGVAFLIHKLKNKNKYTKVDNKTIDVTRVSVSNNKTKKQSNNLSIKVDNIDDDSTDNDDDYNLNEDVKESINKKDQTNIISVQNTPNKPCVSDRNV